MVQNGPGAMKWRWMVRDSTMYVGAWRYGKMQNRAGWYGTYAGSSVMVLYDEEGCRMVMTSAAWC